MPEKNKLYYGDNLDVLRRYVRDESVDLVYAAIKHQFPNDLEVQYAATGLELIINEYKRLTIVWKRSGEEFQMRFDGFVRSALETKAKSLQKAAEYVSAVRLSA